MNIRKSIPLGVFALLGVFSLVMVVTWFLSKPSTPPAELAAVLRPEFRQLQPFELTDHRNQLFDQHKFQEKWTFAFFGYTFCPDICPATLYMLNSVQNLLQDQEDGEGSDIQVLFISVDPARDTTELLAGYVPYFNSEFIGATAQKAEIDRLTRQFSAGYVIEPETTAGQYTVAHTSAIFLVDPLGRLVASFSQPHYAETIASQFKKIQAYILD
jgi:protein SCO1/2